MPGLGTIKINTLAHFCYGTCAQLYVDLGQCDLPRKLTLEDRVSVPGGFGALVT